MDTIITHIGFGVHDSRGRDCAHDSGHGKCSYTRGKQMKRQPKKISKELASAAARGQARRRIMAERQARKRTRR